MSEDLDEIRKQRMRELEGQAQSSQDVNKIQKEQEAREAYESQKQST